MKPFALAACLLVLPTTGLTADFTSGDVVVSAPYARPTTSLAMTGAGYFAVTNNGMTPDTLLEVTADFPRVMMHDTTVADGVATMAHMAKGIVIPAGETVTFAPGGTHVMFMGLNGDPFEIGEEIPAMLLFEKAGKLEITFIVTEAEPKE